MTNEELERLLKIEVAARNIIGHYDQYRNSGLAGQIDELRSALRPPGKPVKRQPGERLRQVREAAGRRIVNELCADLPFGRREMLFNAIVAALGDKPPPASTSAACRFRSESAT